MGSILLDNPLALSESSTRCVHLLSFPRLPHILFSYTISLRIMWALGVMLFEWGSLVVKFSWKERQAEGRRNFQVITFTDTQWVMGMWHILRNVPFY